MKNKFIFSIIFCSFIALWANNVSAQEYKYDLNKYYTPDIVRNGLDLNFYSNGIFSDFRNDTTKSNSLYGNLESKFTQFKNTRKTESLLQLNLNISGQIVNTKDMGLVNEKTNNSNSVENFSVEYEKKIYGTNNKYLSFGLFSVLNPSSRFTSSEVSGSTTEFKNSNFRIGIEPFIGIGIGRIESVKDARQAVYILEDLTKRGVLTRILTDDEIFKFAQVISQVKNKRFLDYRLRKIDEISTVDSFLVKNNLLTKSDASYFTTLYDNWENSANFERSSGQSFEVKLSPNVNWSNLKNESKYPNLNNDSWSKENNKYYGAILSLKYIYANQINLNWEKAAFVSLSGSTNREQYNRSSKMVQEFESKVNVKKIALDGGYGIGYYPSTRTSLTANLSQKFEADFYDGVSTTDWSNSFNSATTLKFSAVYYVSPQLSLSGNTSISNNYSNYKSSNSTGNNNQLRGDFSVALRYSFF